jgi:hypothetical protein
MPDKSPVGADGNRPGDAQSGEFEDLVKAGVIDPAKVVRSALQDAPVAGVLVTTEAMVAEKPKKKRPPIPPGGGCGMGDITSERAPPPGSRGRPPGRIARSRRARRLVETKRGGPLGSPRFVCIDVQPFFRPFSGIALIRRQLLLNPCAALGYLTTVIDRVRRFGAK